MTGARGATLDHAEDGRTGQVEAGVQKRPPYQPRLLHEEETNIILFKPLLFGVFLPQVLN